MERVSRWRGIQAWNRGVQDEILVQTRGIGSGNVASNRPIILKVVLRRGG